MIIAVLGLIVGLIMALTGAGGGILAVPLLIFVTGLTVAQAGPIGLLAVAISATVGTALGLKHGIVRYRAALLMAGAGILCSPIGIWLARHSNQKVLSLLFSAVLLWVAYRTFKHAHYEFANTEATNNSDFLPCNLDQEKKRFVWTKPCAKALAAFGGTAGLLSGLLGVGGGFVIVPALQRYTDLPIKSIIATSLAVIAMVSFGGVVTSVVGNGMNWLIAIPFCSGALIGMLAGRLISARLAGPHLQKAFALVAALIAMSMMWKTLIQF